MLGMLPKLITLARSVLNCVAGFRETENLNWNCEQVFHDGKRGFRLCFTCSSY